jgi:hypothetical protein
MIANRRCFVYQESFSRWDWWKEKAPPLRPALKFHGRRIRQPRRKQQT